MERISKKDRTLEWLRHHDSQVGLRCIHCDQVLTVLNESLVCENNHRFDINRQGYFYLSTAKAQDQYSKRLFEARRHAIIELSLYEPLHQRLLQKIQSHFEGQKISILDAGSGEGSHLHLLNQKLNFQQVTAIGLDLSRAGIQLATDYNGEILSLISDLSDLPLQDQQVDVILSIFSPSNYEEFERVRKKEGQLLKIVPNDDYLQEIRQALVEIGYMETSVYSNRDTVDIYKKIYPKAHSEEIIYRKTVSPQDWLTVLSMTPLTWHLTPAQQEQLLVYLPESLTISVTLLTNN